MFSLLGAGDCKTQKHTIKNNQNRNYYNEFFIRRHRSTAVKIVEASRNTVIVDSVMTAPSRKIPKQRDTRLKIFVSYLDPFVVSSNIIRVQQK